MSKELTEQWRDGKLNGRFYVDHTVPGFDGIYKINGMPGKFEYESINEVLAPVPSYDEWKDARDWELYADSRMKRLEKQLAIAVEALETIENKSDKFDDSWSIQEQLDFIKAEAQSKLHQIEELEK